jgi:hypothetical protein
MVRFYIGNVPHIFRILAKRVAGVLAGARPLKGLLAWILAWNADGVEIKSVIVGARIPKNNLIAPAESPPAMKSMTISPYNAIPEMKAKLAEDRRKFDVERDYGAS